MRLEGVVTNVANFGAFVDIGVHQDGLVHVSQLADSFVKDPREVVKAGDIVTVTVVEVDAARKRIALTMRTGDPAAARAAGGPRPPSREDAPRPARPRDAGGRPQGSRPQGQGPRGPRPAGAGAPRDARPAGEARAPRDARPPREGNGAAPRSAAVRPDGPSDTAMSAAFAKLLRPS